LFNLSLLLAHFIALVVIALALGALILGEGTAAPPVATLMTGLASWIALTAVARASRRVAVSE